MSHSSSAGRSRFEMTPTLSSAITSLSVAHSGHHARLELRPRRINKESVSIVIFVRFAITACFLKPGRVLERAQIDRRTREKSLQTA